MRKKVVLTGAGSAMFTQGLVVDLVLSGKPWELGLVDIDPQALEVAAGLARRMVEARDVDISIERSCASSMMRGAPLFGSAGRA